MAIEYVFWFKLIKRNPFYSNFFWQIQKSLIKVVITESMIRSYSASDHYGNHFLSIELDHIEKISWAISSPGSIGYIKIITQEFKPVYLTPVNPLDPTDTLVYTNTDELIAFCEVVNALKNNRIPDINDNPYIRQLQTKAKPAFLKDRNDILWDKNISPWVYYEKLVPPEVEKKRQTTVTIWKILVLSVLSIAILFFVYAMFAHFQW